MPYKTKKDNPHLQQFILGTLALTMGAPLLMSLGAILGECKKDVTLHAPKDSVKMEIKPPVLKK